MNETSNFTLLPATIMFCGRAAELEVEQLDCGVIPWIRNEFGEVLLKDEPSNSTLNDTVIALCAVLHL